MPLIDAHSHMFGDHPRFVAMLEALDLKVNNICVSYAGLPSLSHRPWRDQAADYRALATQHPTRFSWVTSIDLPGWDDPHYAERVTAELDRSFTGPGAAIGCKVWKNIGMEIKKPDGSWGMIDDPVFTPIFRHLEKLDRPLLMHIGEPHACWAPLDPASPHYGYYKTHPQWHWHGRTDVPTHEQLISARDRVIERHPKLRIIGAHLGSNENDVRECARRFDRFPNYAVDTSARLGDLAGPNRGRVREFLMAYPDRVLWGIDRGTGGVLSGKPPAEVEQITETMRQWYLLERDFYSTDKPIVAPRINTTGIALPADVLEKVMYSNARKWYPGM